MKTFIPFSGGLDSTYLLWKILSETNEEVTALSIDMAATNPRVFLKYDARSFSMYDANSGAIDRVQKIKEWLSKNVRDFNLIIETIDTQYFVRDINTPNSTPSYFTRYAAPRLNDGTFDRICLSHEWDNDGFANGGSIGLKRRPGSWVAYDIFPQVATRGRLEFTLLDMEYNQAYALSELPKDLLNIVRDPNLSEDKKKLKQAWFEKQLSEGKTPKEAGEIAKAKCMLPDGKWHSMRYWVTGADPTPETVWNMPIWPTSITL